MDVGRERVFPLRILQASWGLAVDLRARVILDGPKPVAAVEVSDGIWLRVLARSTAEDRYWLGVGLAYVAPRIQEAVGGASVVLEVSDLDYRPTGYQPDAVALAVIGWAGEELGIEIEVDVRYDRESDNYNFKLDSNDIS